MVEQRWVERAWRWQHDEDRITMVDTEIGVLLIFFTSMAMDSCCSPTKMAILGTVLLCEFAHSLLNFDLT